MTINERKNILKKELEQNNGVFRLFPAWVARTILLPGRRLKLDPRDLYAYGAERGPICERWMASTGKADNGPLTFENEGLSFIAIDGGKEKILLKEAIEIMGDQIIGDYIMNKYNGLTAFAKFYDFARPIPHHVHLMEKDTRVVGVTPKPESYFFPVQMNSINYRGDYTFFGLEPGTTKEDVMKCLRNWGKGGGDNNILELSRAYKLKLGTGWNVQAGILHAPGSLVTYEPQRVSDVSLFMQSMVYDMYMNRDFLTKYLPASKHYDFRYIVDVIDWEANLDPEFKIHHYHEPVPLKDMDEMKEEGYIERWISYGFDEFSAKELTILPGRTLTIKDNWAYGLIMIEGYGTINGVQIETPYIIHYGDITSDEMFVTIRAAQKGVEIKNLSKYSNLVMFKHFGPESSPDF